MENRQSDRLGTLSPLWSIGREIVSAQRKTLSRWGFIEPPYLLAIGFILLGTFISLGSDLGLKAPLVVVTFAWLLHITVGLAAIRTGVILLSRWRRTAQWSDLWVLGVSGVMASVVLAPVSFLVDQWLLTLGIETDDQPFAGVEQWLYGAPVAIFEEWGHVVAPTVLVALLLGVPAWWARRHAPSHAVSDAASHAQGVTPLEADPLSSHLEPRTESTQDYLTLPVAKRASCLQRLPPALGLDLIAVRAELQYVRVYTTRGDALILGALKDITEEYESEGQLVHRSWWISNEHVRALRRRGTRYMLTLSNGLDVPVSRRRQSSIVQQFGSTTTLR